MIKLRTKSKKFAFLAVAAIALTACGGSSENSSSETTAAARTKNNALPGAVTVPDAPTQLGGIAGPNQVELYWKTPANNGGATVTDYYVEMSTDSGATWSKAGWSKTIPFMVTGLVAGKSYDFTVKAANSAGVGTASTAAKGLIPLSSTATTAANITNAPNATVTPAPTKLTVPDAPTALMGVAEANGVILYWKTPMNNGGAAITNYYVEMSTDMGQSWSKAGWSTATKTVVSGLVAGKSYDFTVKAANSVGLSIASSAAKGLIPLSANNNSAAPAPNVTDAPNAANIAPAPIKLTVPDAPYSLSARAMFVRQIELFWKAPINNGGAAITDYLVEISTDMGRTWSKAGYSKTTMFTVRGLMSRVRYTFKVSALNSVGLGTASVPSAYTSAR